MDTEITQIAMQIILHAGDARTQLEKALGEAEDGNFHKVDQLMEEIISSLHIIHKLHLYEKKPVVIIMNSVCCSHTLRIP